MAASGRKLQVDLADCDFLICLISKLTVPLFQAFCEKYNWTDFHLSDFFASFPRSFNEYLVLGKMNMNSRLADSIAPS